MNGNDDIFKTSFASKLLGRPVYYNPKWRQNLTKEFLEAEFEARIFRLSDEEVVGSYIKNRFYLFNQEINRVEVISRPELDEAVAEVEMDKVFPRKDWLRWGPVQFFFNEHPIRADGIFLTRWRPDADEFRRCLLMEVKCAALGIVAAI